MGGTKVKIINVEEGPDPLLVKITYRVEEDDAIPIEDRKTGVVVTGFAQFIGAIAISLKNDPGVTKKVQKRTMDRFWRLIGTEIKYTDFSKDTDLSWV